MNQSVSVTVNVTDLPRVHLGGTSRNLPLIEFGPASDNCVAIAFYTHPDPAQYLRDLAALCIGLAEQVDALPQEVTA